MCTGLYQSATAPGDVITPRQQGEPLLGLLALLGRHSRFKQVPAGLLDVIMGVLSNWGRVLLLF